MGLADKLKAYRDSKTQDSQQQQQQQQLLYGTSVGHNNNVIRPAQTPFMSLNNPNLNVPPGYTNGPNGPNGTSNGPVPQRPQPYNVPPGYNINNNNNNNGPHVYSQNNGVVPNINNNTVKKTPSAKLEEVQIFSLVNSYLSRLVDENGLQAFYSRSAVADLAKSLTERVAWREIQKLTDIPAIETVVELSGLALYNIVILVDNSTSMTRPGRRNELENLVSEVVEIARIFDDDGVDVRVFNDNEGCSGGDSLTTMEQVSDVIKAIRYSRGTPIGRVIKEKILEGMVYPMVNHRALSKPVLVICITDGEPDDEKDVIKAILRGRSHLYSTPYGPKTVVYEFCQVGNDENARQFLSRIDNSSEIGDVVDATSKIEIEEAEFKNNPKNRGKTFSYYNWILKLLLGAVDPIYDAQDDD